MERAGNGSAAGRGESVLRNCAKSVAIFAGATLLSILFDRLNFTHANIIMIYILGVQLTCIVTSQQIYGLVSSIASVFVFNFLFTLPRFSLTAYETGYPVTFVVMFLTAYITGRLALENKKNIREKEAAAVMAQSERLRANLLRSISHDLRTPLTSISGNANNLMNNGDSFDEETKRRIYADIYADSMWLIELVENLLYATRIEDGRMTLRTGPELLSEIVEEAMVHIQRKAGSHLITAACKDDLLLVRADAKLVVQVVVNILDNAIKYTPPDAAIALAAGRRGDMAEVCISDTGNGIPDREKREIFDKFYRGSSPVVDNRRSLGLGLYLCRAIVEAHGGAIQVEDNVPHGAVFRFTLPLEEVICDEP